MAAARMEGRPGRLARILVVDDFTPFLRVVRLILQIRDDLQIVGEASDGLEAVQKAKILQPDLVLLDIDLPTLNGIQVARRLRDHAPRARILFLSVETSSDVVTEALNVGVAGYISKLNIGSELLLAIEALLGGKQFVGSGLGHMLRESTIVQPRPRRHEMLMYSEDKVLLESLHHFVAASLTNNNGAIVVATKPHREGLIEKLRENGCDIDDATQRGTFISLDAAEMLATIMVNGVPDSILFFEGLSRLIEATVKAVNTKQARIAIYGDCCDLLYAEGNVDAAISIEKIGNDLIEAHNIDILCPYLLSYERECDPAFKGICAEHSAVSYR
jgi:DNA-binding NarL/FixJ family response regulator